MASDAPPCRSSWVGGLGRRWPSVRDCIPAFRSSTASAPACVAAPKSPCSRGAYAQSDRPGSRCVEVLSARQHGDSRAARHLARCPRGRIPGHTGPRGVGQDHAADPDRGKRSSRRGVGSGRRHGRHQTERIRGGPLARHPHRVRVPVLQPAARAQGLRDRRAAAAAGAALQGRAEEARRDGTHAGRPRRPDAPLSAPALGRAGAAGGDRAGHRHRSHDPRGGRADGGPRPQVRRRGAHAARAVEQGIQEDHRDGDARSPCRRARAPRAPPGQGRTAMKLVFKNLFRHRLRTALTILGIATAVMAFGLIRTIVGAWNAGVTGAAANRMITRHRVSLIFPIPLPYRNEIARVPGVTAVSWANWFGGVYGEPNDFKNFWPRFAIDPDTYFDLYPEFQLTPDQLAAFKKERNACVIGRKLAQQHGFKLGDVITMEGDIYPGSWQWVVRGIYTGRDPSTDETQMFFQFDDVAELEAVLLRQLAADD